MKVKSDEWIDKAVKNINKWGLQDKETLALAMIEELGELTQAILQYNCLDHDIDLDKQSIHFNRIKNELDNLAVLCFQMHVRLKQNGR